MISEARRLQYLDALGIDVWVSHATAARLAAQSAPAPIPEPMPEPMPAPISVTAVPTDSSGRYVLGPGTGQTLLLCRDQAETASRLASDIARCLDEVPVWGWRAPMRALPGDEPPGLDLESAIEDRLFTRVLIFGAGSTSDGLQDGVIGSARVIHAPPLAELARHAQHKRSLWLKLVSHGWSRRFD